ncbi:glycosyltransferase family 4 protein [Fodinisporobacter ferrooxydans]|uniref:Glycosyltransferase family 4 protein n=1 Tax=Fodinisporobacter ferrooxydans TaxID=2901836 RepID=A0ABY4CIB9_9BACL|nr:glycosyltransferase family 4 protein [Alicyclobacillaceae bacterium MYW30-H2]
MKVVIPVGDLHIGGGCKVLVQIANTLYSKGHDTEVVIPKSGTIKYDIQGRLTVVPVLSKEYIPYGDIILPNFYTTFSPAFAAWPKQCVRLSLGFEPLWVPNPQDALSTYVNQVPIISISKWLDEQIQQNTQLRSTVVNLGVDPNTFYYIPISTKYRLDASRPKVILYIARDPKAGYRFKGYEEFVECMKMVNHWYPGQFVVHMICPANELTLPDIPCKTFFPRSDQEMAGLYRSADLFVSTSWFEAFALPPLEAMACGTPVVATNSGGIMDYAVEGENAIIVPPKDPKSLATAIVALLSNPELAKTLSHGGLKQARRFTLARFQRKMTETLENLYIERRNQ